MTKSGLSKESLVTSMAAYLLENGMAGASLRPLAKAAGTSDRMLIYHFGNKERLIEDVLGFIATDYSSKLDKAFGKHPVATREEAVQRVLTFTGDVQMRPFMALWWEIVAGAARAIPGYRESAQAIMDSLLTWFEGQMPTDDPDPAGGAKKLLTMIEGSEMFSIIGMANIGNDGIEAAKPL
jgi:AcrR family transcriptional regulator